MVLWRISNYATLDGAGGLYASGRWHSKGQLIVYCAQNPSTALLETLVHLEIDAEDRPDYFQSLKVDGPDTLSCETIESHQLPTGWMNDLTVTQRIGDNWLSEARTLLLKVPSILVPETWNILVNPIHPEVSSLKIAASYQHAFDARFF